MPGALVTLYRINFCTGGKNSSVYTLHHAVLVRVAALFLKILLFSKNYSKVLDRSVPDLLSRLDFLVTPHTGLLFVSPLISGVIVLRATYRITVA